jgi:hypothetical protein
MLGGPLGGTMASGSGSPAEERSAAAPRGAYTPPPPPRPATARTLYDNPLLPGGEGDRGSES